MSFDTNAWNKAATGASTNDPPPPGVYEVEVLAADAFESKAGKPFTKITWRVLSGPQTGVCWEQIGGLEGGALEWTKGRLHALGFDTMQPIHSLEHLAVQLDAELVGVQASVKVSLGVNGPYVNTEVLRRLERDLPAKPLGASPDIPLPIENGSAAPAVVEEDNDVIPF